MRADPVIVDAGPLVAFLSAADKHHSWAVEYLRSCEMPLLTCEAVLSEVFFHLRKNPAGLGRLLEMVEGDAFQVVPVYNLVAVSRYAVRHRVDFADACLALLSEKFPRSRIATIDKRDFGRLLRFGDEPIPFDAP